MALNDEWKNTGKPLGGAFANLGKTLIKTAKVGVDKAEAAQRKREAERQPDLIRKEAPSCVKFVETD